MSWKISPILIVCATLSAGGAAQAGGNNANSGNHYGWCRGNGNPHAAECPMFAPSTTSPNSHNEHKDPPLANPIPQIVVIKPLPPQVITGYSPGPQQIVAPPITGHSPGIVVSPNPPQTFTGYGPVPLALPPQQVPPTPLPVTLTRPQALPSTSAKSEGPIPVSVTPQTSTVPVAPALITPKPGRQTAHDTPAFEAKDTGDRWHCVASGHHVRKALDDNGSEVYAGSLPGIAVQVVPIIRDIPAWHDLSTDCIVAVREHPIAKAQRK